MMSKKEITLIVAALLLGGFYVYRFTNFFHKPTIQILTQIRPGGGRDSGRRHSRRQIETPTEPAAVDPISFTFDNRYELTSVKVVLDSEYQTNKYAHSFWHLVSDSNSVPTKGVIYGMKVKGMESEIPKARPEPLQPNTSYRLFIEAGKIKGETVFKTREPVHPAAQ